MRNHDGAVNNFGLLVGRVLMVVLFIHAGIPKLMNPGQFEHVLAIMHAPFPPVATAISIICELIVSFLIAIGFRTRPLALVMVLYTVGTIYLAHRFWLAPPALAAASEENFFKNFSIIGGFLILAVSGPGRYSVDRG